MIFRVFFAFLVLAINSTLAQIIATSGNIQVYLFPEMGLSPFTNTSSLYYPNDTITFIQCSESYIYVLSSNNVLQVLSKSNPTISIQNITTYFSNINETDQVIYSAISFSEDFKIMALSGFYNSTLIYELYLLSNPSVPVFLYTFKSSIRFASNPLTTFVANTIVCSFFSASGQNDLVYCLNISDNATFTVTFSTMNSSFSRSQNGQIGVIWTQNSELYIYNITNNFSLLHFDNNSFTNQAGSTTFINFSQDSSMLILQTDNFNPVAVIQLTSFTTLYSITIHKKIISADFLDVTNRFIFINCVSFSYVYDIVTLSLISFNASINANDMLVDQNSSQIIVEMNGGYSLWATNITINGSIAFGHYLQPLSADKASNQSAFAYPVNLTGWQNATVLVIVSASSVVEQMMAAFNAVVFSSPLTCFFLGFFNYFTLNSLYVLLALPLPDLVFHELASVFSSANTNLLAFFGVGLALPPFTDELVVAPKSLFFGVSSDLLSSEYYSVALILANILLVETLLFFRSKLSKKSVLYHLLALKRGKTYSGLAISMIVGVVLPWKAVMLGTPLNFKTTLNSAIYFSFFLVLLYFLSVNFLETFEKKQLGFSIISNAVIDDKTSQTSKVGRFTSERVKKIGHLPQWMIGFQNFLYPLLVIFQSPMFFLILVLISKIIETAVFVRHSKKIFVTKFFQIFSFACQIGFHFTFFVFAYCENQKIVAWSCIICLCCFFLGAVINFIIVGIFIFSVLIKLCKATKKSNKITQSTAEIITHKKISQMNTLINKLSTVPITVIEEEVPARSHSDFSKMQLTFTFKKTRFRDKKDIIRPRHNNNVNFKLKDEDQVRYNYLDLGLQGSNPQS